MMWIALLIAVVVAAAALAFVAWPLLKPGPAPVIVADDRLAELLGRKDATLQAIKDLEFDYQVGKLSEADFQLYDQRLRRQAIAYIQQIEQVAPQSASLDTAVEAEIAQRRRVQDTAVAAPSVAAQRKPAPALATAGHGAAGASSAPAPAAAAAPVANGGANGNTSARPRFCTNCGNRIEPNHNFCANCGTPAA